MRTCLIILLIVSVKLVTISAWNLNIHIRLKEASKQYSGDNEFDSACHVSKSYAKNGELLSIFTLVTSILLMIGTSVFVYLDFVGADGYKGNFLKRIFC